MTEWQLKFLQLIPIGPCLTQRIVAEGVTRHIEKALQE